MSELQSFTKGLESRFPLLAISNWTPAVVYKIPSSIFFVETLELLTKAQRNKYEALQPKIGDDVTFEAVNDIVVAIKEAPSKLEREMPYFS
jgi:hypothetical protein